MSYAPPPKVDGRYITVAGYRVGGEEGFAQWAMANNPRTRDELLTLMLQWPKWKVTQ